MVLGADPPLTGEGAESEIPTLGGGATNNNNNISESINDPSPLERLIAQSTSEQAAERARSSEQFILEQQESQQHQPLPVVLEQHPHHQFLQTDLAVSPSRQERSPPEPPHNMSSFGFSVAILSASSLCLCQIGLVWSSYLADSWFDTYLKVSAPWKDIFDNDINQLLTTTNLASLLSTFVGAEQHWASMGLLLSSLVIPCLGMILCPSWIVGDYNERFKPQTTTGGGNGCRIPRAIFEFLFRLSLLAFFTLAILDMGTSSIEIEHSHTKILVTNRTRSGLACYTIGATCALAVIVILRLASLNRRGPAATSRQIVVVNPNNAPRAPPNTAFQLPWRGSTTWRNNGDEETPGQLQRPLLQDTNEAEVVVVPPESTSNNYAGLAFCKKTIVFEVGLLSTVLWLPALFLELFEVHYEGLASTFMSEVDFTIRLWEVSSCLYSRGVSAETKEWMILALGAVLISLAYILPLLATGLCIAAWRTKPGTSRVCRNIVWLIHPCLCGIIFASAILLAIPAFGPIGDLLLNEETSGICKRFEQVTDASCLKISASPSLGLWFLLGQSIALEVFVLVTIAWRN